MTEIKVKYLWEYLKTSIAVTEEKGSSHCDNKWGYVNAKSIAVKVTSESWNVLFNLILPNFCNSNLA